MLSTAYTLNDSPRVLNSCRYAMFLAFLLTLSVPYNLYLALSISTYCT